MTYRCVKTDCALELDELPVDKLCPKCWRPMELVDDSDTPGTESESVASGTIETDTWNESTPIGLCTLVCDVSLSMTELVPSMATPSPENPNQKVVPNRIQLVAKNAALGIWDLCGGISKASDAYLAVAVFGDSAEIISFDDGTPFVVRANELKSRFEGAIQLAEFLEERFNLHMKRIGNRTNITDGLSLARQLFDGCSNDSLSQWGVTKSVELIQHDILGMDNNSKTIPNFRTLIYSDGGHNLGELCNAFADSELENTPWSLLMTAFIGSAEDVGASEMQELAGQCPIHGYRNFFLINDPNRFQKLRGLFRMASGASGFCPVCLSDQV